MTLLRDPLAFAGLAGLACLLAAAMVTLHLRYRGLVVRLEEMAHTDSLTSAANRRAWLDELEREMARAARDGSPVCVAMLDVDHFKAYNDRHGHACGDSFLRRLAHNLAEELREVDFLGRLGGEEFGVILPHCSLDEGVEVADRLRGAVPDGQSFSAGVAGWDHRETGAELVHRADQALYEAKLAGRNCTMKAVEATLVTEVLPGATAPSLARGSLDHLRGELEPEVFDNLRVLVSELVSERAADEDSEPVRLRVWVSGRLVRAEVAPSAINGHGPHNGHGASDSLSIELVRQLSDRFGMAEGDMPTWVEIRRDRQLGARRG